MISTFRCWIRQYGPGYPVGGADWNIYAAEVHPDSICFYVNGIRTLTYPRIVNDIDPARD